jgi:hypothetical protein
MFCINKFKLSDLNCYINIFDSMRRDNDRNYLPRVKFIMCDECKVQITNFIGNIIQAKLLNFNNIISKLNNYLIPDLTGITIEYLNLFFYYKIKNKKN